MDDDDGEGDEAGTGLFDLLENNVTLSAYRKRIEAMERERENGAKKFRNRNNRNRSHLS
jgi:hypothetical protein